MNLRRSACSIVAPALMLGAVLCSGVARADGVQLIGTIAIPGNRGGDRTFRYAPLSSPTNLRLRRWGASFSVRPRGLHAP